MQNNNFTNHKIVKPEFTPNGSELSALARLFSASVIQEIAQKGKSPLFIKLLQDSKLLEITKKTESIGDIFDNAYSFLAKKDYRHEYVYKAAITKNILLNKHSLRTSSMLNEFRVEKCKADVVILNGTTTVYEIKSERDTLSRLDQQVEAYRKVFATVNIIVGQNHLEAVQKNTPKDVGVMVLKSNLYIKTEREATDSPERIIPEVILDSIQLHEAKKILHLLDKKIPDVPNTEMYHELQKLFKKLVSKSDRKKTHDAMLRILKETRSLLPLHDFIYTLPPSLHAAVFSTSLKKRDHARFSSAMTITVNDAIKNWS